MDALVDATHPFAETITANAARAAAATGVPAVVLRRPGWRPGPGDRWHLVDSLHAAADLLPRCGSRVFLTTGRTSPAAFAHLRDRHFVVQSVQLSEQPIPPHTGVLPARGPFTAADESALLSEHCVDVLVTKDSGAEATAAKLMAARELALPVVVIRRPSLPDGVAPVPDVAGFLARLGLNLPWGTWISGGPTSTAPGTASGRRPDHAGSATAPEDAGEQVGRRQYADVVRQLRDRDSGVADHGDQQPGPVPAASAAARPSRASTAKVVCGGADHDGRMGHGRGLRAWRTKAGGVLRHMVRLGTTSSKRLAISSRNRRAGVRGTAWR